MRFAGALVVTSFLSASAAAHATAVSRPSGVSRSPSMSDAFAPSSTRLIVATAASASSPADASRTSSVARSPSRLAGFTPSSALLVVAAAAVAQATQTGDAAIRAPSAEAIAALEQAVSASPASVEARRKLAGAYLVAGRPLDAVAHLRKVTELAPKRPAGWYALGQAYNTIKQEALRSFDEQPEDAAWRQLLTADALAAQGQWTDAFALYRATLERLPSMISIRDAIARIYERTGHADWAARERAAATLPAGECVSRRALCEFRARRYQAALRAALTQPDPESRYWRARAANELALAAFGRLDALPDSLERRSVRATKARAEQRYPDAVAELGAALEFAPGDPSLTYELAAAHYMMRDYERALATLTSLLRARPDDPRAVQLMGYSLLHLRRIDEALPVLRRAVEQDAADPGPRLALGRAYLQHGDFAAAIPLLEAQLAEDRDGSLHLQLARAYNGLGQRDKSEALLARSQALQRAAEERNTAATQRKIAPPEGAPSQRAPPRGAPHRAPPDGSPPDGAHPEARRQMPLLRWAQRTPDGLDRVSARARARPAPGSP